ncbi:hypothetical protein VTK26DRAFT_8549 [Humicola hyalothermophila]
METNEVEDVFYDLFETATVAVDRVACLIWIIIWVIKQCLSLVGSILGYLLAPVVFVYRFVSWPLRLIASLYYGDLELLWPYIRYPLLIGVSCGLAVSYLSELIMVVVYYFVPSRRPPPPRKPGAVGDSREERARIYNEPKLDLDTWEQQISRERIRSLEQQLREERMRALEKGYSFDKTDTSTAPTFPSPMSSDFARAPAAPATPLPSRRRSSPGMVLVEDTIVEEDDEGNDGTTDFS